MSAVATPVRTTGAGSWLRWVVSSLFGLLFAFAIFIAIINLVAQAGGAQGLSGLGWVVMLLPVIFPAVAFVACFVFARRRRVWQLALVFVAGLALTAVFWLDIVMFQISSGASLLG